MSGRFQRRIGLAMRAAVVTVMLSAIAPAPASADLWCWLFNSNCDGGGRAKASSASDTAAPEIDPAALANGLALLGGGAAILTRRSRRSR
jgi:hypothetical protein